MPDPQELLLTVCHLPAEEDVGRSFQAGSPLSIGAGWVRGISQRTGIAPSFSWDLLGGSKPQGQGLSWGWGL